MFHKGESPFFGSFSDSKYSLSMQRGSHKRGQMSRFARDFVKKGTNVAPARADFSFALQFCTLAHGAIVLALHFRTLAQEGSTPKKHSGRGDPPKSLAKKIGRSVSFHFPSFLAKSSSSSLESSKGR